MRKIAICLICLPSLLAQQKHQSSSLNLVPSRPGMVLVAVASDGFALAADGAQLNADGTTSQADRLFPIGKEGAALIAGSTSIQDPIGSRVREELDVSGIVAKWLDAHPDMSAEAANRALNSEITTAATQFFQERGRAVRSKKYEFDLVVVGLQNGLPHLMQSHYTLPAGKDRAVAETTSSSPKPGEVWAFGGDRVAGELLSRSNPGLAKFQNDEAVKKLHSSKRTELTIRDYQALFDVMLRAAESPEGKKLDRTTVIAPPNKSASITQSEGFSWKK